ncbi:hypothetical protein OXYTRIMIC_286 [Oxytricha trifallax]|uniref:Uncharacterized protein n=1 Tax=Oxytricha trifallax TaxID=1172189 RepID=A0A073IBB6_9SPIT|nr:hypothetical protein OXYTRIMIC_286 [Oxytricha trifallax]
MEEIKVIQYKRGKLNSSSYNQRYQDPWNNKYEKRRFWEKVQEVRHNHRDRSRDQEILGEKDIEPFKVPLNKQMGFKSKLRIGNSNPSKKINPTQNQRAEFDKHKDGSECIQRDKMKLKEIIDLSEVKCQGFDKIIYAKKGRKPQVTTLTIIVCCPSTRSKVEKALVRRFQDRQRARWEGAREIDLWSERQQKPWKEINGEWRIMIQSQETTFQKRRWRQV